MLRRTMLFKVREGTAPEGVAALEDAVRRTPREIPGIVRLSLGRNLDLRQLYTHVWELDFESAQAVEGYGPHPYHTGTLTSLFSPRSPTGVVESLDFAYYAPIASGARPIGGGGLLRRVMLFQIGEGVSGPQREEVEARLLEMPRRIPAIGNWALSRTSGQRMPRPWTHVWELEFADEVGLETYGKDPFHLDVVAPYFRPGSPTRVVEALSLAWYRAEAPLISPD